MTKFRKILVIRMFGETGICIYGFKFKIYLNLIFSFNLNHTFRSYIHVCHCIQFFSNCILFVGIEQLSVVLVVCLFCSFVCFVCLFVYLFVFLSSHSRIFHSHGDVTITSEGLQILIYARHSWLLSSEGSLACLTYCDTGQPFIMRTHPWHSQILLSV